MPKLNSWILRLSSDPREGQFNLRSSVALHVQGNETGGGESRREIRDYGSHLGADR